MQLRSILAATALALVATFSADAGADSEYGIAPSSGQVVVTASSPWHINQDFPWKLTVNGTKYDKSKWTFTSTSATLSGLPSGGAHLKGAVCSTDGDQQACKVLEADVTIP